MNSSQNFVYVRTYSHWLEEKKRRETYEESVDRTMDFFKDEIGDPASPHFLKIGKQAMMDMSVMPSMRTFWSAGRAAKKNHVTMYNCSFITITDIQSFSEILFILMCGTGVGFSVEKKYVDQLPVLMDKSSRTVQVVVEDSREGWAKGLDELLRALWTGLDVSFDVSKIRPRGSRLITMGGRASGPEPLVDLFKFAISLFQDKRRKQQSRLHPIDVLDLCNKIAEVVVMGGVRRSSEISLSDASDIQIARAKTGEFWKDYPHRSMSNNSIAYNEKPDVLSFLDEFQNLIKSGTGERGIFNRAGARKQLTASGRRKDCESIGVNPCVPSGTEILTKNGYLPIDSLVGETVDVWNGFEFSTVIPRITGKNQHLVRVDFSSGQSLRCTKDHFFVISVDYFGKTKRVKAKDLEIGMKLIKTDYPVLFGGQNIKSSIAYTQGFISADGMDDYNFFSVYETKYSCLDRMSLKYQGRKKHGRVLVKPDFDKLPKNFVPFHWNLDAKLHWLSGLLDGDGTVCIEGGLQIVSVNKKFLLSVQKMLTTMGTPSKVTHGSDAGLKEMPDGRGGYKLYECLDTYRLLIGSTETQNLINMGLVCSRLKIKGFKPNRSAGRFVQVVSVSDDGIAEEVYCFTETKRHMGCFEGIVTGQCGEILLRPYGFCNLSEVIVRPNDNRQSLIQKVKVAAMFGSWQATFTNFPYLRKKWKQNCEEERLLGVSLTGIMDNPILNNVNDRMKRWLGELKSVAISETEKWCGKLNINMSAAITCIKPSGTASQVMDCASGIHPRYSNYYIRRYRISANDPLFRMLRDQGVPYSPEVGQEEKTASTFVLDFPICAPKNSKTRNEFSALQQLEHWKILKEFWTEHNPSITVYVGEDEWLDTAAWCYRNFDDLCGVSFLPRNKHVYQLAPYQEISKSEYDALHKSFPEIDYGKLSQYEQEDNTDGESTYSCVGDKCELL